MKKRTYRGVWVKDICEEKLAEAVRGRRIVVGVDAAKETCYGQLLTEERLVVRTVKWSAVRQVREVVALLRRLPASRVEMVMEPSSTYQDPLRYAAEAAGIPVYRVGGKRSHDAAEVYDGVPSMHDGKAAYVVARLHLEGVSRRWEEKSRRERELRAAVDLVGMYDQQERRLQNRLEAQLGRHWPELTAVMDLGTKTVLNLLATCGGPEAVRADPATARKVMSQAGGRFLRQDKVEEILASARATVGVATLAEEQRTVQELAQEALRCAAAARAARRRVVRLSRGNEMIQRCAPVLGKISAAALFVAAGDPRDYPAAASYVKALGLNLKERSSGKHQGQLKITKRGPSEARRYLYLAALRLLPEKGGDPVVRAWYARKVQRDGGRHKMRAAVALTRKLAAALWHVARGASFDSTKLFDTRRLGHELAK